MKIIRKNLSNPAILIRYSTLLFIAGLVEIKEIENFYEKFMGVSDYKPYKIEFNTRPEYLYVYVSGEEDSLEISRQFWQEIAEECGRIKCGKILIVEDIKQSVTITEMYQIASEIPQMGFFGTKIAFVDCYIEHQNINDFGEIVATNRGIYGKIFNDVAEAEKWLLSN